MDFQTCVKTGPGAVVVSSPVRDFDELCVASSGRGPFADVTSVEEAIFICDGVIDLAAALFGVSGKQLRATSRSARPVARVRQIGMYVAHVALGMTMTTVGLGFGRDKSTVVHACHTIEDLREDPDFDAIVARTEAIVRIAFRSATLPARND